MQFIITVSIILALFAPDIWVITGGDQRALDSILIVAACIFVVEVCLRLVNAADLRYFKTVYFALDVLGAVAITFDVSFLGGRLTKADQHRPMEPHDLLDGHSGSYNLVVARAARCASLGTRAARYSWVVRLLNTLCMCCLRRSEIGDLGGVETYRNALMHAISVHVASLTVLLVAAVPLLGLLTYPKQDLSMAAWIEILSRYTSPVDPAKKVELESELKEFNSFYEDLDYAPYYLCLHDSEKHCSSSSGTLWGSQADAPDVEAAHLGIKSNNLSVFFDFTIAREKEAVMGITLILFAILVMIFMSLFIAKAVSDLVLRPMQRMLASVKEISQPMFGNNEAFGGLLFMADDEEFA